MGPAMQSLPRKSHPVDFVRYCQETTMQNFLFGFAAGIGLGIIAVIYLLRAANTFNPFK